MEVEKTFNMPSMVTGKPEGLINIPKWPREIDYDWPTKTTTPLEAVTSLSGKRDNFRDVLMS